MENILKPEAEFRDRIDKVLDQYFEKEIEVVSVCKSKRIDYVLKCKTSGVIFGLEVKSMQRMRGQKFGLYLKQASNYSSLLWNTKFGKIKLLIFISPAISNSFINVKEKIFINDIEYYISQHNSNHEHSNVNSFIGDVFNIGEIRQFKENNKSLFKFMYRNKVIWESNSKNKVRWIHYNFYNNKL
jgi:hypothetical protein